MCSHKQYLHVFALLEIIQNTFAWPRLFRFLYSYHVIFECHLYHHPRFHRHVHHTLCDCHVVACRHNRPPRLIVSIIVMFPNYIYKGTHSIDIYCTTCFQHYHSLEKRKKWRHQCCLLTGLRQLKESQGLLISIKFNPQGWVI